MPPLYVWYDETSKKEIEILRPFAGYQEPPTEEEARAEGLDPEKAKWEKRLGRGIRVTKSDSWGPGKGNWGKA
jgi:hypothetical protein